MSVTRTAAALAALLAAAGPAAAQTFTILVTTTSNTGSGSLRQAISFANQLGVPTAIGFNVPGGGTIRLGSDLPILTDPGGIAIDGANAFGGGGPIVIDAGATDNATGHRAFFVGVGAGEANAGLPATSNTAFSFSNLTISCWAAAPTGRPWTRHR